MAKSKRRARRETLKKSAAPGAQTQPAPAEPKLKVWHVLAGILLALIIGFQVYQPAINGPFLFDDRYLMFTHPDRQNWPLSGWVEGVRPMLMFTYWLNYQASGMDPYWYHVVNVLFHLGGAILVFFIVRKLLIMADVNSWPREPVAAFAAGVFLLHPLQTEAVAYVASRSENLSVFLFYAAFAAFLYRGSGAISFPRALLVLVLFGAAVTTKEHTALLPALLLLTDFYWNPGFSFRGIVKNWRLYIPIAGAGVFGGIFIWRMLSASNTAGFSIEGLPWYEYFLTQCKAIWIYARMFVLPFGLNVDHDYPMTDSLADPASIAGLAGLILVVGAAWWYRRRYPLISYGIFVYLLLLAPTSSFVPINDALVERRAYLPSIGLLIIAADLLRRWKVSRAGLAGALSAAVIVVGILGYQRNLVWASPVSLWEDSVSKTPDNWRANFQLAYAYYDEQRCSEAAEQYAKTDALQESDYRLLVDWAHACDCAGKPDEAIRIAEQAAALDKTAQVYALIGMLHGKQGNNEQALEALDIAEKINRRFEIIYFTRGNVYATMGNYARAAEQYRRAIELDPSLEEAHRGLQVAEQRLRQQ